MNFSFVETDGGQNKTVDYKVLSKYLKSDNKLMTLNIEIKQTLKKAVFRIDLPHTGEFTWVNRELQYIYYRHNHVQVENIEYLYTANEGAIKSAGAATSGATTAVVAVMTVVSASSAVVLIKIFQMIDYMVFYNVEHPKNLISFMEVLSSPLLDMIPNPL